MSKRLSVLLLVFSLLFFGMFWQYDFFASSGRLSKDSICTSGGVTYGSHGNGHWHRARQEASGWYPVGADLGHTSPCVAGSRVGASGAGGSRNRESSWTSRSQPPKLELGTTSVEKFFFELNKELTEADLIKLFDVKAMDSENGDLSHKITVDTSNITVDNRDESHEIIFAVMNDAGVTTETKATLHIKKRDKPILSTYEMFTYTQTPTCKELLKKQDLFIIDSDGQWLGLTCDHVHVDESNNRIIIRAADQFGLANEFFVNYKIVPSSARPSDNSFLAFLVVSGIGVFFYNRRRKKKRRNLKI